MEAQPLIQENHLRETDTKTQWVYKFGAAETDGSAQMRNLLGGKGANLAEMCQRSVYDN